MTNIQTTEPSPDSLIQDLHRIRESLVDSFAGDLHALSEDARRRQQQSGRRLWKGEATHETTHRVPSKR